MTRNNYVDKDDKNTKGNLIENNSLPKTGRKENAMKRISQITIALLGGVILFISTLPAMAMTTEFFDHASFVVSAGNLTTIDFDAQAACNNCLAGNEFIAQGLTIIQRDGYGINVVQNLAPGGFGANFLTEGNINSPPNVISSTIFVTSATGALPDNYDFVFTNPVTAAGLFIGNLGAGGCCPLGPTTVEFLDAFDGVIASEVLTKDHLGVIFGATGQTWDNRIFYGIISDTPINRIRVTNGPNDLDGINLDDIQFSLALAVEIDIKPGSFPNSINLGSSGTVPVAILSTSSFDATTVDPTTIALAGAQVRLRGRGTAMASFEDVNGDGLLDLVVHVSTEALQLSEINTEAALNGRTFNGIAITGSDSVRVVP